jgi:hypothetical protein
MYFALKNKFNFYGLKALRGGGGNNPKNVSKKFYPNKTNPATQDIGSLAASA